MMNFAVLASGRGGNLKAIIKAVKAGKIKAHLKVVISDKKDAYALEHARRPRSRRCLSILKIFMTANHLTGLLSNVYTSLK